MAEQLIGRKPHQAPQNSDLGDMAYQSKSIDVENITIGGISTIELMIKGWNPSYWYDYTDARYKNGNLIYNKGVFNGVGTLTNTETYTMNGRDYWTSNGNTNAYFYHGGASWGVYDSYFFVSAYSPYEVYNAAISGAYYADGNSGARVSVSTDSFGNGMDNGELSHHAGQSSGYDVGNQTGFGGRLTNDPDRQDGPVIHAVAGYFGNWNDTRGGDRISMCTLDRGTLRENLVTNGTACGGNTTNEIYWGNRHTQDRGRRQRRMYAEMIIFRDHKLNEDQYALLEHYFKLKYGGPAGRGV